MENLCQIRNDQYEESNQFENDEENDKIDSVNLPEFSVKLKDKENRYKQIDIGKNNNNCIENEEDSKQRLTSSMLMHKSRPSVDIKADIDIMTGFKHQI